MEVPSPHNPGYPRTRKLRKGTFSCLECKRRKRRCEFQPSSSDCSSCKRRGLPCVSQECDPERSRRQVAERVSHVEDLVTLLVQQRRHQGSGDPARRAAASELRAAVAFPRSPCGTSTSITTYLRSVFPPPLETATILSHKNSSLLPSNIVWSKCAALQQEQSQPPPEANPIWFGRKFMELALCLQDVQDQSGNATRYVEIVSRQISSLDTLLQSADGIMTLMLEAIYYINDEKPKVAWLKCRRALSIAQLLRLERPRRDLDGMFFRLLYGDRIMSLELGLPYFCMSEAIPVNSDEDLRSKLEYTHSMIACRIIERNMRIEQSNILPVYDEEARKLDSMMKRAMNYLPVDWWSVKPSLLDMTEEHAMAETAKLSTQLSHYWFLMKIHQPFVIAQLRSHEAQQDSSYSGSVIAAACRQVLSRFIVIRKYHSGDVYRGTDSKAISAAVMLLLAHIESHRHHRCDDIQHLRPQDIGLVNEMLSMVDVLYRTTSRGCAIRKLLEIEADAAGGSNYLLVEESADGLPLSIPYIGVMSLVKRAFSCQVSQCSSLKDPTSAELCALGPQDEVDLLLQGFGSIG